MEQGAAQHAVAEDGAGGDQRDRRQHDDDAVAERERTFQRRHERMARGGVGMVILIRKRTMHHAVTSDASFSSLAGIRGLGAVVLPRGIAGDVAPFADGGRIERADLGAGLFVDLGDFDIVGLGALAAERFQLGADREDDVLMLFRQPSKIDFDINSGSSMNQ